MNWLALFWTISAATGIVVTLRVLSTAIFAWHDLKATTQDRATLRLAFLQVRGNAFILWIHSAFFIAGLTALLDHEPGGWLRVVTVLCLLSAPWTLAINSLLNVRDRHRIATDPQEPRS